MIVEIKNTTSHQNIPDALRNNTLPDILKMPKEELRKKLLEQEYYVKLANDLDCKQVSEGPFSAMYPNYEGKWADLLKGIHIEKQILDDNLWRYFVTERTETMTKREAEIEETKIDLQIFGSILKCVGMLFTNAFICTTLAATNKIETTTGLIIGCATSLIVCANTKHEVDVKLNTPISYNKVVKELYAMHYNDEIFIKRVDPKTPVGSYKYSL